MVYQSSDNQISVSSFTSQHEAQQNVRKYFDKRIEEKIADDFF